MVERQGPSLLIRVLYFLLVGWWLGAAVAWAAWIFIITILLLPLGIWLIDRLPTVVTLRPYEQIVTAGATERAEGEQRPFLVRAIYFLLVGWWFSGLWIALAYLALLSIILIPVSFWMFERIAAVTTLFRY